MSEWREITESAFENIPDGELFSTALAIRSLLKPDGQPVVSVPTERDGLRGETARDEFGRLMILRSEAAVYLLFERLGFQKTASWHPDGRARLPVESLVERWTEYYRPLMASPEFVPQNQGEEPDCAKPISFRRNLLSSLPTVEIVPRPLRACGTTLILWREESHRMSGGE